MPTRTLETRVRALEKSLALLATRLEQLERSAAQPTKTQPQTTQVRRDAPASGDFDLRGGRAPSSTFGRSDEDTAPAQKPLTVAERDAQTVERS